MVGRAVDPSELLGALRDLRQRVERVYVHVDLDVLDTSVGQASPYAAAGGPDLGTVVMAITETFDRFEVPAAALTADDPRVDDKEASPRLPEPSPNASPGWRREHGGRRYAPDVSRRAH